MTPKRRIAVIGGGSAGFTAARTAHRHGALVVLFMGEDPEHASLCVNEGCMPSKTLFHAVDDCTRDCEAGGAVPGGGPIHPDGLLAGAVSRKDRYVARWRAYRQNSLQEYRVKEGFEIVPDVARFTGPGRLRSGTRTFNADAVILATGSAPIWPPIEGLQEVRDEIWTNVEILRNTEVPDSLAVIGAGPTGLEFSLRYRRLGAEVTLISLLPVLGEFDRVFGERLTRSYEDEGVRVLAERRVSRIALDRQGLFTLMIEGGEEPEPVVASRVLLAAGREPLLGGLDLEAAGIPADGGRLRVGEDGRVEGQEAVFAAGDVVGRRLVVHKAHIEAQIAARNAVSGGNECYGRPADLEVVFSDPEFATAGLDERELSRSGKRLVSSYAKSRLVGKLYLEGDRRGIGKMTADAESGEILSVQLLCAAASDLIHLPSFAIERGLTVSDLALAEFYHPTRMEIVSKLADQLCVSVGRRPRARGQE